MQERIDLVVVAEEKRRPAGLSVSVIVSLIAHTALMVWFITSYKPTAAPRHVPMARYVDLMRQQPQAERDHVEAPGPAVRRTPLSAPLSDKNRKASMPEPTGPNPTKRPGDGSNSAYTPPSDSRPRGSEDSAPPMPAPLPLGLPAPKTPVPDSAFVYNEPARAAMAGPVVDLRKALRDASRTLAGAPGGSGEVTAIGGEQGTAEQGPLSFETQWYDWGDYAQSMVSKIRVNWYANMPQIIRTGMKGVVTIRFTIHRDGRISDITILNSSGVPPYDASARRAIELSSPLKALPADFPNATERVTCMFYYNMEIPQRS